jgi:hypothetical protein
MTDFITHDGKRIPRIVPTLRAMAPGSPAAVSAGCVCPIIDNFDGQGYRGVAGIYVVNCHCPVHRFEYWRSLNGPAATQF